MDMAMVPGKVLAEVLDSGNILLCLYGGGERKELTHRFLQKGEG